MWESEITPEVVRAWGYGEDLFSEQDEDLLLHDLRLVPVLLDLVGDDKCPKQRDAFYILCQFSREQVTRGGDDGTAALRTVWSDIRGPLGGDAQAWFGYVRRLLEYAHPSGPVDKADALQMAKDLLLGPAGRVGKIAEQHSLLEGWWRFTLRTSVIEHVDVCKATGAFKYIYGDAGSG